MPINIPNIDNINEVNPVYRDGIAAIFKCTRDGWVEILTQIRPTYVQSGTEYTPSPMSDTLCEMKTDGGNQHVYFDLVDLPKVPEVPVFTALMFSRNHTASAAASVGFSVCNWSGVKGWSINTETYNNTGDTGVSKSGVADMPFSSLESANVETHTAIKFKSDNSAVGFTDEGTDTNTNTSGFKTSGTNNRIVIGGAWRSAAFSGPSYANVGPYVILWNKLLSDDQITNLAANPALLKDPTLLSPMQLYSWLYLGGGAYSLTCDSGTYNISGTAVELQRGEILVTDSGSYTYSGTVVELDYGYYLATDSGSYTYSGTTVELDYGYYLATDSGSYTYSGTAVTLTYAPAGGYTLTCDSGSYTYSGTVVELDYGYYLATDSGSYTYSGTAVTLTHDYPLSLDSGNYAYSGTAVALTGTFSLTTESGTYTYTGTDLGLIVSGILTIGQLKVYSHEKKINIYSHERSIEVY